MKKLTQLNWEHSQQLLFKPFLGWSCFKDKTNKKRMNKEVRGLTSSSNILNSKSSFWSLESCSSCCSWLDSASILSTWSSQTVWFNTDTGRAGNIIYTLRMHFKYAMQHDGYKRFKPQAYVVNRLSEHCGTENFIVCECHDKKWKNAHLKCTFDQSDSTFVIKEVGKPSLKALDSFVRRAASPPPIWSPVGAHRQLDFGLFEVKRNICYSSTCY